MRTKILKIKNFQELKYRNTLHTLVAFLLNAKKIKYYFHVYWHRFKFGYKVGFASNYPKMMTQYWRQYISSNLLREANACAYYLANEGLLPFMCEDFKGHFIFEISTAK